MTTQFPSSLKEVVEKLGAMLKEEGLELRAASDLPKLKTAKGFVPMVVNEKTFARRTNGKNPQLRIGSNHDQAD